MAKPNPEDQKVAHQIIRVHCLMRPVANYAEVEKDIASAIAAEREKAAKGDINAALAELREMLVEQDKFPPYITVGFDPNNNWQSLFVIHLVVDGTGQHFEGATLLEAMQKVREWKDRQ